MRIQSMGVAVLVLSMLVSVTVAAGFPLRTLAAEQDTVTVSYEMLNELLIDGSFELKQANESYETNRSNYQEMLDALREERDYMRFLAEQNEDDPEALAVYESNAAMLTNSVRQVSRQLDRINSRRNIRAEQDNIDSYTRIAQTRMNSYNQLLLQLAAQEKRAEAAAVAYEAVKIRQSAGMASGDEVMSASDTLRRQQSQVESYRQQTDRQRRSLLNLLGIDDNSDVTIGAIPQPDMSAIASIDYEADRQRAVSNNDAVLNARHAAADSTSEVNQRFKNVAEAEGNAQADYMVLYQELMEKQLEYQAAADAYERETIEHHSLQLRNRAGLLTQEAYLLGEVQYLQAFADWGAASMNLVQAYEDYCWGVRGIF